MSKFEVTIYEVHKQYVEVDANSEAEAREIVMDGGGDYVGDPMYVDMLSTDSHDFDVEEITED